MLDVHGTEVKEGDRIKMILMENDPCPIEPGTTGMVEKVQTSVYSLPTQLWVKWDTPRSLMLVEGDQFEILPS